MKKKILMLCATMFMAFPAVIAQTPGAVDTRDEAVNVDRGNDLVFINEAAGSGMLEVELGKIAQDKAASASVKEFGRKMEKHHSESTQKLKNLANNIGVPVPPSWPSKHQDKIKSLSEKTGSEFDKEYIDQMVTAHKADIEKYEKAVDEVTDTELKQFISSTLPVLKEHLKQAENLKEQVKNN